MLYSSHICLGYLSLLIAHLGAAISEERVGMANEFGSPQAWYNASNTAVSCTPVFMANKEYDTVRINHTCLGFRVLP